MTARPDGQRAIIVLGIARSGTSALSGALAAMGVDFGNDLKPADWRNPRGNFEHFRLSRLNQRILAAFDASWSKPWAIHSEWRDNPEVLTAQNEIREIIRSDFAGRPLFGLKDPRLVLLFTLYSDVLKSLGIVPTVIGIERRRPEVIASIRKSGYYHTTADWLIYPIRARTLYKHYEERIATIIRETDGTRVNYVTLISDPKGVLVQLSNAIRFEDAGIVPNVEAGVAAIDRQLYRNRR